ncbi:MAG: hypothetical protein VYC12_00455 [Candidatus Thermoplasmatota archaeon]|nr:hypothetical protein [Candidatus Thermoplasmatota archaeon]
MSFFEDLMNNRDKQIMALSIVFFVLAFPIYFGLAAANADGGAGLNAVNMYEVTGEVTYIEIAAGDEFIADGDTLTIDNLHTDSIDDADDLNIVGVILTMSYTEAEDTNGFTCAAAPGNPAEDTITGMTMHGEYNETASGSNNGDSGGHAVESYWINESIVGEIVVMSKAEIISMVDADGAGLGASTAEITVDANAGNAGPGCTRSDAGEDVVYKVELVVFDYDIRPFFEVIEEI